MKKQLTFLILYALSSASLNHQLLVARPGFGIGVILGEPTGVSIKNWLSNRQALDAALAWSLDDDGGFHVHGDYLVHHVRSWRVPELRGGMRFYYGVGLRLRTYRHDHKGDNGDTLFGVRFPLGLNYVFHSVPFDFFVEVVPILDLVPGTDFDLNAALGARIYF